MATNTEAGSGDLERQPLLLFNENDNLPTAQEEIVGGETPPQIITKTKPPGTRYKWIFFSLILAVVLIYLFVVVAIVYLVCMLKSKVKENIYSLNNLVVEKNNSMQLTIDAFEVPRMLPASLVKLSFNSLIFPIISMLKVTYYLPDCQNNPTIPLDIPINFEFLKGENNSIVPLIKTELDNDFIPYQLSHQICVATEDYVLTPLDLMIEYVSRNKAEKKDSENPDSLVEEEKKKSKDDAYWDEKMKIGFKPHNLALRTVEIPEALIKNSAFIQQLEILNRVDFNNTKFDIFNMKLSGDFFIEITLDMLKNVDLINFKMLKGDFIINLKGSEKEMLLVEIPQWQDCTVYSKQSDGLDMIIEVSLKEANVKVLNQNEFTKFGKRWLWDKRVDVGISSDIDLIISNDKWLGSMVLRGLKSHDEAELRA